MPDTTDYLTRIRDYTQGKDPLELQAQTPAILAELLSNASDQQLTTRPGKDKWSIGEILAHLAEDEIATAGAIVRCSNTTGCNWRDSIKMSGRARETTPPAHPAIHSRCSDCCAPQIYSFSSTSARNSGNAMASIPSVATSRLGIWPSIWPGTISITSSKSARSWDDAFTPVFP